MGVPGDSVVVIAVPGSFRGFGGVWCLGGVCAELAAVLLLGFPYLFVGILALLFCDSLGCSAFSGELGPACCSEGVVTMQTSIGSAPSSP